MTNNSAKGEVANKLAIFAGKIKIPGCEPETAVTSSKLAVAKREAGVCNQSMIPVAQALELIPGSYVMFGAQPSERWFVLPDGPPPDYGECNRCGDWYGILKTAEVPVDESINDIGCDSFSFTGWCDV